MWEEEIALIRAWNGWTGIEFKYLKGVEGYLSSVEDIYSVETIIDIVWVSKKEIERIDDRIRSIFNML